MFFQERVNNGREQLVPAGRRNHVLNASAPVSSAVTGVTAPSSRRPQ
jgi:hypothetical protein